MKCIKNLRTGAIFRVSDDEARSKVKQYVYAYTNKESWKAVKRNQLDHPSP